MARVVHLNHRHFAFTGTKEGYTADQAKILKRQLEALRDDGFLWMHNGDCVGSDASAAILWKSLKGKIMLHPPSVSTHRAHYNRADIVCAPRPYLVRDHDMVDCSELVIATPKGHAEELRSGTWATVRYARKMRRQVIIVWPFGRITRES